MRLVILLGLRGGQPARMGALRFMNKWATHHELVRRTLTLAQTLS